MRLIHNLPQMFILINYYSSKLSLTHSLLLALKYGGVWQPVTRLASQDMKQLCIHIQTIGIIHNIYECLF